MIVTNKQVREELIKWPYEVESFSKMLIDENYFCPSIVWLLKDFINWCKVNPVKYIDEKQDCDNIAEITKVDISKAFQRTKLNEKSDCACWIVDLVLVPTSNYFGTIFDFEQKSHTTILIRCNDNNYYIFERTKCETKSLTELLSDSIVDRVVHVRL